jgi:hypothetical protein
MDQRFKDTRITPSLSFHSLRVAGRPNSIGKDGSIKLMIWTIWPDLQAST